MEPPRAKAVVMPAPEIDTAPEGPSPQNDA